MAFRSAPAPDRVGPYDVVDVLGRGGMGIVYRARQRETGRLVALKTLTDLHDDQISGLRHEIHALSRLHHPQIVRIIEHGVAAGLPWYAMEMLAGETLRARLATRAGELPTSRTPTDTRWWSTMLLPRQPASSPAEPAPPPVRASAEPRADVGWTLELIERLCEPLGYLHGQGLVHGDLKLENVLLVADDVPVLVDFGLSSRFAAEHGREALSLTPPGSGTIPYMAPEQLRWERIDARADLYALGCIMYEFLTGGTPFGAAARADIVDGHLHRPPVPPSRCVAGLDPALDALVLRLLAKDRRDRFGHTDDVLATLAALRGDAPRPPRARPHLFPARLQGRAEALLELGAELERARDGARLALVTGPAGVGKTRLALELVTAAEDLEFRVVAGSGSPDARDAPLQPLRPVLQHIADGWRRGDACWRAFVVEQGAALRPFLPMEIDPSDGDSVGTAVMRHEVYVACAAALEEMSRERRLLLVLDDLQWSDELTQGLLDYLARQGGGGPGYVVVAICRSDDLPDTLEPMRRWSGCLPVEIGPLPQAAVGGMVADMLACDAPPVELGARLASHAGGSPLFVAEYLRSAVDQRLLVRVPGGAWRLDDLGRLPRTLDELFDMRIGLLTPPARAVAWAVAVLGGVADDRRLAAVYDEGEGSLWDAIDELCVKDILIAGADGEWRFSQPALRDACYRDIPEAARARLHGRAAAAIERSGAQPAVLAELARHWELADDPTRAREIYRAAARAAVRRDALSAAEAAYRSCIRLSDESASETLLTTIDLARTAMYASGRRREAVAVLSDVIARSRRLGHRLAEGRALYERGFARMELGDLEQAAVDVDGAQPIFEALDAKQDRAHCAGFRGLMLVRRGERVGARAAFAEGLALARAAGYREYEGVLLGNLAIQCHVERQEDEARALFSDALRIHRALGDRRSVGRWTANLAVLEHDGGNLDLAHRLYEEALASHRATGNRSGCGNVLGNLANLELHRGRRDVARELYREALAIHREVGARVAEGHVLGNLGELEQVSGNLTEARGLLEQALALHEASGARRSYALCLGNLSGVLARQGHLELAEREALRSVALARAVEDPDLLGRNLCELARIARRRGDLEAAADHVRAAAVELEKGHDRLQLAHGLCEQVRIDRLRGGDVGPLLDRVRALVAESGAGPDSLVGREVAALS